MFYSGKSDISPNSSESNKPSKEQLLIMIDKLTETVCIKSHVLSALILHLKILVIIVFFVLSAN